MKHIQNQIISANTQDFQKKLIMIVMKEKINNKSCSVCNSEINGYGFYMTEDKK